jgi:DNA-binding NarL/FixJ family response regulator
MSISIWCTALRTPSSRRALEAGVSGYVLKAQPAEELANAVRGVHRAGAGDHGRNGS